MKIGDFLYNWKRAVWMEAAFSLYNRAIRVENTLGSHHPENSVRFPHMRLQFRLDKPILKRNISLIN